MCHTCSICLEVSPCPCLHSWHPVVKNPPCNAGDAGLIPGQGTKIPHAVWLGQKKRKKAHMLTQHTVLALVSGTRTKAACVWFYLPNSLLSLPLIIKLPTPTSDSYFHHSFAEPPRIIYHISIYMWAMLWLPVLYHRPVW